MNTSSNITILFFGDIVGKPGRRVVKRFLASTAHRPDLIIANIENVAHGFGVSESCLNELSQAGVQVFSGGNHTFDRKDIFDFIDKYPNLLRPANYPDNTPGKGCYLWESNDLKIGIINVMGRVFMEPLNSPFVVADQLIEKLAKETKIILVDIHAEATAEKNAMGLYLDGRVSAVIGSHTHVQTADERILPNGTAYITDAGCCAPHHSVIGMDKVSVLRRFIQQLPARFEIAKGPAQLNGVLLTIDKATGKAIAIERVAYLETQEESNADKED